MIGARRLVGEFLSPAMAQRFETWIEAAHADGPPPQPWALCGDGAPELAAYMVRILRDSGIDAVLAPESWLAPGAPLPERVPRIAIFGLFAGEPDLDTLDRLAQHAAVLIATAPGVPTPLAEHIVCLDMPPNRLEDLRLLGDLGFPIRTP